MFQPVIWEDWQPGGIILKRSKRQEGSADQESSARTERLKAKRNLDGSGDLQWHALDNNLGKFSKKESSKKLLHSGSHLIDISTRVVVY
jgi:hypothetical protein